MALLSLASTSKYKEIKNGLMNGLERRTFFIAKLIPLIARKVGKSYS